MANNETLIGKQVKTPKWGVVTIVADNTKSGYSQHSPWELIGVGKDRIGRYFTLKEYEEWKDED